MKQKATPIVIALLVIITVVFVALKFSDIEIAPLTGSVTHPVSEVAKEDLISTLASSGNTIGIRIPPSVSWESGETGSFVLGLRNKYNHTTTFSIIITSQKSSHAEGWLTYQRKKTLPPSGIETIPITARPLNPQPDIYSFRILVCESTTCSSSSSSLYASTTFHFSIT